MSTEELKKKIKKELPEILQNMFDDSVILDVKIEDDTEKHKNHDKYIVTVYIQDQPEIQYTHPFIITSSTKAGNKGFNVQKKKVKDWFEKVISEKRRDLIEHMVANQYTTPQPQRKSPTLKQDHSTTYQTVSPTSSRTSSPISPSPRSPTKSKWNDSKKEAEAKKQEYIHDNFDDLADRVDALDIGVEEYKGDEESEKSEDTEDEAAAKKRAEMTRRIREDIIWSPQQKRQDRKLATRGGGGSGEEGREGPAAAVC